MKGKYSEPVLEVCCADIESVKAAKEGGADRIELCSALESGGLTPSIALIRQAVTEFSGPVNVLIRPRSGDFLYTDAELNIIEEDIISARKTGASGIVFGALTPDGSIDVEVMKRMIKTARPCSFTLHRAFDMVKDPLKALENAVELGVDRILTSGCAPSAIEGIDTLKVLNKKADGRVIILAGAGVSAKNASMILESTGGTELHASCKTSISSKMVSRRDDISMGLPDSDEFCYLGTSADLVSALKNELIKK